MRGIERAAAYIPGGAPPGAAVASRDEDGFTLGATALERLVDDRPPLMPPTRLLLVGDLPSTADTDLVRFLGFPVHTERFGTGAEGLAEAVDAAMDPVHAADPVLVIVVDLPSDSEEPRPAAPQPSSDAAVALRFSERSGRGASLALPGAMRSGASGTLPVLRLGRDRASTEPETWVGDFVTSPGRLRRRPKTARVGRPSIPSDGPVSQGAYVPRPRYLENLPSRWRFAGEKCGSCGALAFPPRGQCRQCGATQGLVAVHLPRDGGEVVASTTIGPGGQPTEFDEQVASSGPYGVVLVELVPGARVTLQVTDARPGQIAIGSRVATRLRRLYPMEGEWRYGRKAVPLP
jgi:uncharacterized protein